MNLKRVLGLKVVVSRTLDNLVGQVNSSRNELEVYLTIHKSKKGVEQLLKINPLPDKRIFEYRAS